MNLNVREAEKWYIPEHFEVKRNTKQTVIDKRLLYNSSVEATYYVASVTLVEVQIYGIFKAATH